jgi:hypothetical protein
MSVRGRENRVWVVREPIPPDLDPLDEAPQHVSQYLLDPNAKDPSAW